MKTMKSSLHYTGINFTNWLRGTDLAVIELSIGYLSNDFDIPGFIAVQSN